MEKGKVCLPLEEERIRISDLIDDFLIGLKKIKNEFIASKWDDIEKLRMELRFLRTFVLFGNSNLDNFYQRMSMNIKKFDELTSSLFYEDEDKLILVKYNMDKLAPYVIKEIASILLRLKNVAIIMTEENMFEYSKSILKHLHDLPKYCSYLLLPLMSEYKILRQVCRHIRDFYELECNKTTTTEFLYARYQMTVDRVTQFCFDLWTGVYKENFDNEYYYDYCNVSQCSSKITSLLIDIIPLELEVLYISTSKLIKESTSTQLKRFVKQILKASPRILQNYLIHLQRSMVAVKYAPTQSINVMMEFLLIFLTDIPKRFIHREKLNDILAHAGMLTRKISFLVSKLLEKISENSINEADFSAPDFLQEIEQMKGDIRQIFLKAPESSQLRFPMDDGFLFMNLLLRQLNDLLIANVYSVTLIKKEIVMVKESLEFLTSSFGKVRKTLNGTSGVVKDCWLRALDVAYEAEHVINSILVRDKALSHLIFSLPDVTDMIKLIVAQVTSLQLEDKNGDEPLDSLEETTQSYLDALISSSLIMVDHIPSWSKWWTCVMIKVCYMHDVVHDFCSVKAKKEKFFKLINSGDPFHPSDLLHRRLTVHTDDDRQLQKRIVLFNSTKCSGGCKHLISLKVSGSLDNYNYTSHLRLVRVLQLDGIVLEDSVMDDIGFIFHLRFLSIRANMEAIPESWVNLQNLETLLINTHFYSTIVLLPRILQLSKLKHVSIDESSFFDEEEEDNIQSRILEGENSKLTTLSKVDISYSQGTNDALEKFPNLEHLDCTIMVPEDPPTHGDWFPKFNILNKLQSLIAEYICELNYHVCPIEYHFPTGLKELRLFDIPMRPALLSAIVALPQLKILEINYCNFVMDKWDASEEIYQSLKTLRLACPELSEWEVDRETFPKLEELILENCFMLTEIPYAFGDIDTLKSVHVVKSELELGDSAMKIKKDVIDFTGEDRLHVHIS